MEKRINFREKCYYGCMEKIKYNSLNEYLRKRFGGKVYKLSLDGGFTCPNRDGKIDTRGCIFCSAGGSGDFAADRNKSITEQIESAKERVAAKMPKEEKHRFIAYFQAFTNTYAPIDVLRKKYSEAILHPDIVALSVATRPDCLDDEIIDLLKELNNIKPVWVELGLQTIHEKSIEYIRRGYPTQVYDYAVEKLKKAGIDVITHVILGLPGESREDMLETVRYVANTGTQGIKLQLLHILKETDLYKDYLEGKVKVLEEEEYLDLVKECVLLLPEDMIVHRLTGDGDKKILVAPMWSADKKHVLAGLSKRLEAKGGIYMIREIKQEDIAECVAVIRSSFLTVANEFGITEENGARFTAFATDENRISWHMFGEHRPMYGYYEKNKLIGYYSLLIKDNGECELNNLSVLPEYRHNRIGFSMLEHSFEKARELGCTKMNIGIVEENTVLRSWYEKYGFVHTGTEKYDFFPFTCGYMVKEL